MLFCVVDHHRAHSPIQLRRDSLGRYSSSSPEPGSLSSEGRSSTSPGRSPCMCSVCGKRYKHRSCLHKHLWEHHDAWETCLKYNLTKHQQVQMMEAAQVLVDMMGIKTR
ncbi:hypothetical protein COEREDRAFT_81937 [Coemansia reversa NRRL 1564]|uniref:C2H2-type domain-containing protein n=1 Tax=Coemansia reversa (strain ATCC 12441 / NRRL 1564) TaxID=763665 RepID=A0A2G5B9E6_COERN|nr:hypothetical protein COEREDRAFT_81937 [Coemansia reversa NRRL 1564]|eukprot:PIA15610.1 hypothetical protein COEREDRAFT_81937 [Coemansia reversa NRRL 1564]